jgi:hypothetical protein
MNNNACWMCQSTDGVHLETDNVTNMVHECPSLQMSTRRRFVILGRPSTELESRIFSKAAVLEQSVNVSLKPDVVFTRCSQARGSFRCHWRVARNKAHARCDKPMDVNDASAVQVRAQPLSTRFEKQNPALFWACFEIYQAM